MSRLISASLRKSFADVTRRKGRTLLVALGIFIGVFGLTAINTAEDALFAAITFSMSSQAVQPDILVDVNHLDPALLPTLQAVTDVRTVQYQTVFNTQWHVSQAPGHIEHGDHQLSRFEACAADPISIDERALSQRRRDRDGIRGSGAATVHYRRHSDGGHRPGHGAPARGRASAHDGA